MNGMSGIGGDWRGLEFGEDGVGWIGLWLGWVGIVWEG